VAALAELAQGLFPDRRAVVLGGITHDRAPRGVFRPLRSVADSAVFVAPPTPRARPPEDVAAAWRKLGGSAEVAEDPLAGLRRARGLAGPGGVVIVAGSFYLAGAVRPALRDLV
jgi:dihydrofolate synthase/folylpolyglutamate synthase